MLAEVEDDTRDMMTRQKAERIVALVEEYEREERSDTYVTAWVAARLAVTEAKAARLMASARDCLSRD